MQTYTINFPEPEEPPVSMPSVVYHYLHDVLGSVIGLVDESGALRERYTYDPYGKVFIEYWGEDPETGGAWLDNATANTAWGAPSGGVAYSRFGNPFMWTGHRYDAAVGLYATLYRTYSPTLGRWLQRDPIEYEGGSINLYEYVASAPMHSVDQMGLRPIISPPIPPPHAPGSAPGASGPGATVGRTLQLMNHLNNTTNINRHRVEIFPDEMNREIWMQGRYHIKPYRTPGPEAYNINPLNGLFGLMRRLQDSCRRGNNNHCELLEKLRDLLKQRRKDGCMKDCMQDDDVVPVLCNQPATPENLHNAKKNKCDEICENSVDGNLPENGGKGAGFNR